MRIALMGYGRSGKDAVASFLVADHGYTRVSFGDLIKADLDQLVQDHLGFSAFTEVDEQKELIRPTLEAWSVSNNANLLRRFYEQVASLPDVVNNRLMLPEEVGRWHAAGGHFVWVHRPGFGPRSKWEEESLFASRLLIEQELKVPLPMLWNSGDLGALRDEVGTFLGKGPS